MKKKSTTYYVQSFVNVDSNNSNFSTALTEGYETQKTTFVYFPFKGFHQYYENDRIRKACNILKIDEIKSKNIFFLITFNVQKK